jgi:U4/U6.U5 tri-snRNP-associated protein 3
MSQRGDNSSKVTVSAYPDEEDEVGIDNVEDFRSKKRQIERSHRPEDHDDEEDSGRLNINKYERDGTTRMDQGILQSISSGSRDYVSERERRMARLRQQLKEEDDDLAAVDQGNGNGLDQNLPKPQEEIIQVNPQELDGMDEDEQMKRLLGFDGFGSTKGEAVEDNHSSAARGVAAKNKARKYRQYMNRKNGFNRPLEKMN